MESNWQQRAADRGKQSQSKWSSKSQSESPVHPHLHPIPLKQQRQQQPHKSNGQRTPLASPVVGASGSAEQLTGTSNPIASQPTDPIESIANVLNQHSRFVQKQKKSRDFERHKQQLHLKEQQQQQQQQLRQAGDTLGATQSAGKTVQAALVATPTAWTASAEASKDDNRLGELEAVQSAGQARDSSTSSCSPAGQSRASRSQVDQGNSYLYAYNHFLAAPASKVKQLQQAQQSADGGQVSSKEEADARLQTALAEANRAQQSILTNSDDSAEEADDALSYILHQHTTPAKCALRNLGRLGERTGGLRHSADWSHPSRKLNVELSLLEQQQLADELDALDAQTIEHHLSCSRSSHPRHICGIGGSHTDELNHIANRLRQQSRRAFELNQPKAIASSRQSQQFAHDLRVVEQQLRGQQRDVEAIAKSLADSGTLKHAQLPFVPENLGPPARPPAVDQQPAHQQHQQPQPAQFLLANRGLSSESCSSTGDRPLGKPTRGHRAARQPSSGAHLSWLFAGLLAALGVRGSRDISAPSAASARRARARKHTAAATRPTDLGQPPVPRDESSLLSMYSASSSSQQIAAGQAGAYYASQQPAEQQYAHQQYLQHQQAPLGHLGGHAHAHQYPLSSDSSLGSSAFASSALRLGGFLRSCCSKKCLLFACLLLIVMIFVFVIALSAYLNFLISSQKTSLSPLSGRLRVDSPADTYLDELANRTSRDFQARQLQYETILRGALDRTQPALKSYPNHLVKLEVYAFRPGSLWVYFRLFLNRRSLAQDGQLMRRKAPDEQLERQFLPRLTQQALQAGFEQLLQSGARRPRSSQAAARPPASAPAGQQAFSAKSFDDQISRLMPIIEAVDLQSIQVTPEFDMQHQQAATSETLLASQPLSTAPPAPAIMVATGAASAEYELATPPPASARPDEVSVSTRKFFLQGYKENLTRPAAGERSAEPQESLFLVNQQLRPAGASGRQSNTVREIASAVRPSADKVVRLLSGQPVASQSAGSQARNVTLQFGPKQQQQQQQPQWAPSTDASVPASAGAGSASAAASPTNDTLAMQMAAPYQRSVQPSVGSAGGRDQQGGRPAGPTASPAATSTAAGARGPSQSVHDLWDSAINNRRNNQAARNESSSSPTAAHGQPQQSSTSQPSARRLISVTTISAENAARQLSANADADSAAIATANENSNAKANNSDASVRLQSQKVSLLSSDVSDAIRAQLASLAGSTSTSTSASASASASASTSASTSTSTSTSRPAIVGTQAVPFGQQKPKVSPHLKQGGSLLTTATQHRPDGQQPSAVLLSRDFHPTHRATAGNEGQPHQAQVTTRSPLSRPDKQLRKSPQPVQARNSSSPAGDSRRTVPANSTTTTTTGKPNISKKPKKVAAEQLASQKNLQPEVANNGTVINSKGIRIVDNFLATVDAQLANRTATSGAEFELAQIGAAIGSPAQRANGTLEHVGRGGATSPSPPTLPTTIELARSTTAGPLARTTSLHATPDGQQALRSTPTDSGTPRSEAAPPPPPPLRISTQPSNRPGTSSFSNQWRPIAETNWSRSNRTGSVPSRKPSLTLIVPTERQPPVVSVPAGQGSQSPFAMSTSILEDQPRQQQQQQQQLPALFDSTRNGPKRTSNRVANSYSSSNEFESHRMSRMRQANLAASAHLSATSSTSSSLASSTSTLSSINVADSAARLVDDFVITTERAGAEQPLEALTNKLSQVQTSPVDVQPRRTRGPFAFETLKSMGPRDPSASDPADSPLDLLADEFDVPASRSERSPAPLDPKLLLRKRLFVGPRESAQPDELTVASSTHPPLALASPSVAPQPAEEVPLTPPDIDDRPLGRSGSLLQQLDRFGNRKPIAESEGAGDRFQRQLKCQFHGCRAKGSPSSGLVCLNQTQICDDFIDCQDESDELDCVSLLKYDGKTNRLSFSNGAGIVYLNRKGSLAPMCVDYFSGSPEQQQQQTTTSSRLKFAPAKNGSQPGESVRKQQELIRQINTIGLYACSLQSFSHLVSVKINHHQLVDGLDLIKTAKEYHRLSLVGDSERRDRSADPQGGSYKLAASEHEVEVSSSADCPSQRTVFVKCGSFECGQDSFSVIDQNNLARRSSSVIINDFPWLVKLHWMGSLSCHGYLIDEMWLIAASECFANRTNGRIQSDGDGSTASELANGWTAEISYEHYGNDDYKSIESNRRNIKQILARPTDSLGQSALSSSSYSSIVLAKLEEPVRFSMHTGNQNYRNHNGAANGSLDSTGMERIYRDCVTAALPSSGSVSPTQDLLLSKAKFHQTWDCLSGGVDRRVQPLDQLICVSELAKTGGRQMDASEDQSTRVLICSASQVNRSRSKWTVIGVQNKMHGLQVDANRLLFTSVSSQLDWIVDTMNPKSYRNLYLDGNNNSSNELNPSSAAGQPQNQTCNQFKCSSGECLSWSRICDGLYDCSSNDDEKDCHK